MADDKKPPGASPSRYAGRGMAFDSAEHLFAAFPILTAIAHWTGKIGTVYIKRLILSGKINEAKRNAAIIVAAVIVIIFLLILGCVVLLALLPAAGAA